MRASARAALLALAVAAGSPSASAQVEPDTSAVGRVNNSVGGHCTGILVGARIAITAAHCLYNRRTARWLRPEAIHFLVGYDRGTFAFHAVAESYRTGEDYDAARPFETIAGDWAVLRLAVAAPAAIVPMALAADRPAGPRRLRPAGFAKARPHVLTLAQACTGAPAEGHFIVSDCTVPEGFSGGPLIDEATGRLAGISVATSKSRSLGIPATVFGPALDEASGGD